MGRRLTSATTRGCVALLCNVMPQRTPVRFPTRHLPCQPWLPVGVRAAGSTSAGNQAKWATPRSSSTSPLAVRRLAILLLARSAGGGSLSWT